MQNFSLKQMIDYLRLERQKVTSELANSKIYKTQLAALQNENLSKSHLFNITVLNHSHIPITEKLKNKHIRFFNKQIELNQNQKQAVFKAASLENSILSIQGPPGTGKTSVIVEIIQQEIRRNKKSNILISSQSNLAVDNILEKIVELKSISVVRLGREENCTDKIKPHLKERKISRLKFKANTKRYIFNILSFLITVPFFILSRKIKPKKRPILGDFRLLKESVQVVAATCIGCNDNFIQYLTKKNQLPFDLLIIDEAGKCTPMESLVPLQYSRKAIFVGDHKQLPPIVTNEVRSAWLKNNNAHRKTRCPGEISLFEILMNSLPKENKVILNKQFRMHPQIGDFISKVFYQNENLTNGVSKEERSLPIKGYPESISFHSTSKFKTKSRECFDTNLLSYFSPAEISLCMEQLKIIDISTDKRNPPTIGIVSLYKAQVDRLTHEIQMVKFQNLPKIKQTDIATLDSFQGREKDIIILSLARSPQAIDNFDAKLYKFFLDVRRLNVALSRARKRLFIIGDLERITKISQNKDVVPGINIAEQLLSYIKQNNLEVH